MYAIIETGGKQYRVKQGDILDVELVEPTKDNKWVEFKQVLFFHSGETQKVGLPYVNNCLVQGEILGEIKGPKVIAYKYKRRRNYYRKKGHRQKYSRVKITEITAS